MTNTFDQTPAWKARVAAAIKALGLTIDPGDAANHLLGRFPVGKWSPTTAASDQELKEALHAFPGARSAAVEQAAQPRVHAANQHLIGTHPAPFLAQLGAQQFDQLPPARRITMWRLFEEHGSIHGPSSEATTMRTPVSRVPEKLPNRHELPSEMRGLMGMKLLDAARAVAAADKAKADIEAHKAGTAPLSPLHLDAAQKAVERGFGGSVRP